MKRTIYILLSLFLLVSCQQEDILNPSSDGYLQLQSVTTSNIVTEEVNTRAVENDLYIHITGNNVNTLFEPGDFPQEKIKLKAGSYELEAYNEAYNSQISNAPRYYAKQAFSIEAEKVRYLDVEVPMINVGISLAAFSDELSGLFTNPYLTFYTTDPELKQTLQPDETVYFDYTEGMIFSYTLTATNADNETFTTDVKTYGSDEQPVEAGHCYVITYSLASTKTLQDTVR
ncbi:DUF4493 domain-containing protein [uncultured Bacteroides sp.]|uniref:DUF4493 domain-containing protein n=1 Tax=uncultured Bacteroides sp. TaxID=162156 RepID=UPI00262AE74D|nr:DUF4493 domain-containing protein [uncultured Bacteroides sp.]